MPRLALPLRTIRVALLICGELTPKVVADHGNMFTIYQRWLKNSLPRYSDARLVTHGYDVAGMNYPNDPQLSRYDAVILTGSPSDAWVDEPWIKRLVTFVRHVGDEHPQIKIYGICFGHQIISRALGGISQRNASGWELGRTTVHTTDIGKMLFGVDKLELQQLHQDHVPLSSLSSSFSSGEIYSLGFTDNTDTHGLVKFYSQSPDLLNYSGYPSSHLSRHIHVMTIQGHPEFHDNLTSDILRELHASDPNTEEAKVRPRAKAGHPASWISRTHESAASDMKNDGVEVIGKAFWRMFGIRGGNIRRRRFFSE